MSNYRVPWVNQDMNANVRIAHGAQFLSDVTAAQVLAALPNPGVLVTDRAVSVPEVILADRSAFDDGCKALIRARKNTLSRLRYRLKLGKISQEEFGDGVKQAWETFDAAVGALPYPDAEEVGNAHL